MLNVVFYIFTSERIHHISDVTQFKPLKHGHMSALMLVTRHQQNSTAKKLVGLLKMKFWL